MLRLLMRFIYGDYDSERITKLAGDDTYKRVIIPIDLYILADKYDVAKLDKIIASDVRKELAKAEGKTHEILCGAIKTAYTPSRNHDTELGKVIASVALEQNAIFWVSSNMEAKMLQHPTFAADVALALVRENSLSLFKTTCTACRLDIELTKATMGGRLSFFCPFCTSHQKI